MRGLTIFNMSRLNNNPTRTVINAPRPPEKAQITMTVSTMTFDFNAKPSTQTIPLSELVPYTYKGNYTIKKSAIKYAPTVAPSMDALMAVICAKMKQAPDDDF